MTRPIPPEPDLEPAATYSTRLADWWRLSDVALRANQAQTCAAWTGQIVPVMGPTLDRIADAWDALDERLGALADALRPTYPAPSPSHPAPVPVPAGTECKTMPAILPGQWLSD